MKAGSFMLVEREVALDIIIAEAVALLQHRAQPRRLQADRRGRARPSEGSCGRTGAQSGAVEPAIQCPEVHTARWHGDGVCPSDGGRAHRIRCLRHRRRHCARGPGKGIREIRPGPPCPCTEGNRHGIGAFHRARADRCPWWSNRAGERGARRHDDDGHASIISHHAGPAPNAAISRKGLRPRGRKYSLLRTSWYHVASSIPTWRSPCTGPVC